MCSSDLNTPEARRRIVDTVAKQQVPFAVVSTRYKSMIWDAHPELGHYIDTQFRSLRTYPIYGSGTVDVRVNRSAPPRGTDAETGWPCFR